MNYTSVSTMSHTKSSSKMSPSFPYGVHEVKRVTICFLLNEIHMEFRKSQRVTSCT